MAYNAFVCEIPKFEPSNTFESLKHQVWKDAIIEEYQSILKNDVWDIVPRPKGKFVVSFKWLFKVKYVTNDSIENIKPIL